MKHRRKKVVSPELKEKIKKENEAAMAYADKLRIEQKEQKAKQKEFERKNKVLKLGISGIYFLKYMGETVYVGESICIMSRIVKHSQEKKKIFDKFHWFEHHGLDKERKATEKRLIKQLQPKYNITHKVKPKKKESYKVYGDKIIFTRA